MSVRNFDTLLNILDQLEKEDVLPDRERDWGSLQVQLRFFRMMSRWAESWLTKTLLKDLLPAVETDVTGACFDIRQPYEIKDYVQISKTLRTLVKHIRKHVEKILQICQYYIEMHRLTPFVGTDGGLVIDDLVKQLLDPLLQNIDHLIRNHGTSVCPLKEKLQDLQGRLIFVKNCLAFRTTYETRESELLDRIEVISENALFVCSLCWWAENKQGRLEIIVADLLLKIEFIEPFIRLVYSRDLKAAELEDQIDVGVDFQALAIVNELYKDLSAYIESDTNSAIFQAENDQIAFLLEGLWFLRDFLMYTPRSRKEYFIELGRLHHLLTKTVSLTKEVRSVFLSVSHSETKNPELSTKFCVVVVDLLNCIDTTKAEIKQYFVPDYSSWHLPMTLNSTCILLVLQNLQELVNDRSHLIHSHVKHRIETLLNELLMLISSILNALVELEKNEEGLIKVTERVITVSQKAEFLVDSITICTDSMAPMWCYTLSLSDVLGEIDVLKNEVTQICDNSMQMAENISEPGLEVFRLNGSFKTLSLESRMHSRDEEEVVGFYDEAEKIRNRLERGPKHLDIVSIVGMPGLGKTTLAQKLYKSRSLTCYFSVRAWCCISQVYTKRGLLLDLLADIDDGGEVARKCESMTDDDLAELLCRSLKGRRYLIVLDDIWSIEAWEGLRLCFPDQANGSRILLTSRVHDVSLLAKPNSDPVYLRMFSNEESWLLLQKKVFRDRNCPQELFVVGEQIAGYCRGLPLSVVVVAGMLKDIHQTVHEWNAIAESIRKHTYEEESKITGLLELSYKQLPCHLQTCFLYMGIFPEEKEISVQKLVSLWRAEGLVLQVEGRNLEDSAEDYLKDLVGRSLVMVAKRKSKGGIKACRLHDLLLQFCLEKTKEEKFLFVLQGNEESSTSRVCLKDKSHYFPKDWEPKRLSIRADPVDVQFWRPYNYPHIRSLLFFVNGHDTTSRYTSSMYLQHFPFLLLRTKLLRVLDLAQLNMGLNFPDGYQYLSHLRYFAIQGKMGTVPSRIVDLWNLETFIFKGRRGEVSVHNNIWKLRRLRHLQIRDRAGFAFPDDDSSFASVDIETIATPSLRFGEDSMLCILASLPRLRKLRCIFLESWDFSRNCNQFPVLDFLSNLESLKVFYHGKVQYPCGEFSFPLNLKKLTLSKFRLPWSQISIIGRLPNLEVLKLLFKSFEGDTWDVNDEEFTNLKFLKLEALDVAQWDVSMCSDPFPRLEQLVLQRCKKLESIPSEIGYVNTLQRIEVQFCSRSAAESAEAIQEEQLEMGNSDLQVHIHYLATIPEV